MKTMINRGLLSLLWAAATHSLAGTTPILCPQELQIKESASTPDPSWEITSNLGAGGYPLDSVNLYLGHPRQLVNLAPDKTSQRKLERQYSWKLTPSSDAYWVACTYANSLSMLTNRLPENLGKCALTETLLPSGKKLAIAEFVCE